MNPHQIRHTTDDPLWAKIIIGGIVFVFLGLFLVIPLVAVFYEGLKKGIEFYFASLNDKYTWDAIKLTVIAAFFCVVGNTIFGVSAAWLITKHEFRGKSLLISLIELPFAVSPVIAGLMLILLYSVHGFLGPFFIDNDIRIIFATPGIILATIFVTFPFVARELIPLMQSQGKDEEISAIVLGANGWRTFWRVTLPNIKWGLLYGVIQCNARAIGEFGAVSVVSGHIRGKTNTVPLHIEILYNEYQFTAAFALSSMLALLALITLVIKSIVESRVHSEMKRLEEN
ncbi:MAG: sulfate ABC transporter permease subunit CysW [Verrucomicrobiota bacterium]|nr:sulfate ABC transporter permease subunit CysW [Verrucomicrobiota bacterium]